MGGVTPSDTEAAQSLTNAITGIKLAGIPLSHIFVWFDYGYMNPYNSTGLSQYGQAAKVWF